MGNPNSFGARGELDVNGKTYQIYRLSALADKGLDALKADPHLAKGLNVLAGQLTHPAVAEALGKTFADPYGVWG